MTIKNLMYTQKVPFLYTERARVVFSGFEIRQKDIVCRKKCCKYFGPERVRFWPGGDHQLACGRPL